MNKIFPFLKYGPPAKLLKNIPRVTPKKQLASFALIMLEFSEFITRRILYNDGGCGKAPKESHYSPKRILLPIQFAKDWWISQKTIGRMFCRRMRPKKNFVTWIKTVNTVFSVYKKQIQSLNHGSDSIMVSAYAFWPLEQNGLPS